MRVRTGTRRSGPWRGLNQWLAVVIHSLLCTPLRCSANIGLCECFQSLAAWFCSAARSFRAVCSSPIGLDWRSEIQDSQLVGGELSAGLLDYPSDLAGRCCPCAEAGPGGRETCPNSLADSTGSRYLAHPDFGCDCRVQMARNPRHLIKVPNRLV